MIRMIGIILIIFGIVIILWGDKDLSVKGGELLRLFSWPHGTAKWAKWPFGIVFIYTGLKIIFSQ